MSAENPCECELCKLDRMPSHGCSSLVDIISRDMCAALLGADLRGMGYRLVEDSPGIYIMDTDPERVKGIWINGVAPWLQHTYPAELRDGGWHTYQVDLTPLEEQRGYVPPDPGSLDHDEWVNGIYVRAGDRAGLDHALACGAPLNGNVSGDYHQPEPGEINGLPFDTLVPVIDDMDTIDESMDWLRDVTEGFGNED